MASKTPFMDDSDPEMVLIGLPTLVAADMSADHTHRVLNELDRHIALVRTQLFLRSLGEAWPADIYQASVRWEEDQCMKCTYVRVRDMEGNRVDSEEVTAFEVEVIGMVTDTDHHFMEMLNLLFDDGNRYVTQHELPQLLRQALSPEILAKVFQAQLSQELPTPEAQAPKPRF